MKKILWFFIVVGCLWWGWQALFALPRDEREFFPQGEKAVRLLLDGKRFEFERVTSATVEDLFRDQGLTVPPESRVFPERTTRLAPGDTIWVELARSVSIRTDGKTERVMALARTTEDILSERGLSLDEDDIVEPSRSETVPDQTTIVVTRVEIKEESKDAPIAYTTKTIEDDQLSWRKKIVKQKGEQGIKRTLYRVSYHDGQEVRRRVIGTEVVKEPVEEIITQGTYVKTGKSHRGAASWYAWTGTMAAANPWLPKGSYVRVTNLDNGKSVIVVINDRGPFVPGRIIDLDKVAFQKIASLGAGVINVKMEEIVN